MRFWKAICFLSFILPLSEVSWMGIGWGEVPRSPAGGFPAKVGEGEFLITSFPVELWDRGYAVEAWIYLERDPNPDERFVVIEEPRTFRISVIHDSKGTRLEYQRHCSLGSWEEACDIFLEPRKWHHIGLIWCNEGDELNERTYLIKDGRVYPRGGWSGPSIQGRLLNKSEVVIIGVREEKIEGGKKNISVIGYIDGIRISKGKRYKWKGEEMRYQIPRGRLKPDMETIALWHFDEGASASSYRDMSGRKNTLFRKRTGVKR